MAGAQCHRLLWWRVHEPDAEELKPDVGTQDLFDQSREVEREARKVLPPGSVFEASFVAQGVAVRVDALVPENGAFALVEVKSSSSLKDEHIPDAAVQAHILRKSGVDVRRVEVMDLNKQFRHSAGGELFVREDVTTRIEALQPDMPQLIAERIAAARGPLPAVAIGKHCSDPRACPFWDRCWPKDRFHVTKLYRGRDRGLTLMSRGIEQIQDIPPNEKLTDTQKRQKLSAERGGVVVQPGLAAALGEFTGRLGFLDFETISRAIPVWPGTRPWQQTVVQFSYHEQKDGGGHRHAQWLAEGPEDPREKLAQALLEATKRADRILMYSTFERSRIRDLMEALPHRRAELEALEAKLVDLLPVLQQHVYHPDFNGSFSLKYTLTPLVPDMTYTDLMIRDGMTASVEIWRLLFVAHKIAPEKRARLRQDLLDYCHRDTEAMVKLLEALRALAGSLAR